jgi:hypothetical protein
MKLYNFTSDVQLDNILFVVFIEFPAIFLFLLFNSKKPYSLGWVFL